MGEIIRENLTGINIGNLACCLAFSLIILLAFLLRNGWPLYAKMYVAFLSILILNLVCELLNYFLTHNLRMRTLFVITNVISFTCVVLVVVSFYLYLLYYSEERYGRKVNRLLIRCFLIYNAFCIVLFVSSVWTGLFFVITEDVEYVLTPYSYIYGSMMLPSMILMMIAVIKNFRVAPLRESVIYLVFIGMLGLSAIMDATILSTSYYSTLTIFAGLIFILVDIEQQRDLEEKQREILLSELKALRLQMNPHYVYNTLASIDGLITFDPDAARTLIGKFIKHLRGSYLNDMPMMIPIQDEIRNLKYYIDVEKTRFPNIEVEFDMHADDFEIPPLVIQPLVENAIKHGICGREESAGKVTITSAEEANRYIIRIVDNGIGYDMTAEKKEDGRTHVGINNTVKRLQLICGGTLMINSIVGIGTEAEIIIPKGKKI